MGLRRGQRGLRNLHHPTAAGQTAQIERRRKRLQIGRPRKLRSRGSRRLAARSSSAGASLPRFCVYTTSARKKSTRASPRLIERSRLGCEQQFQRRIGRTGEVFGSRRRQRAPRTPWRVDRQLGSPLEECGLRGHPTSALGPGRRQLELGGDPLVRARCRLGAVPGAPIRIGVWIRHVRQHPVDLRRSSAGATR